MLEGEVNRATGATAMNERSSRSHSAVIVHVEGVTADSGARSARGALPRGPGGQRTRVAFGSHRRQAQGGAAHQQEPQRPGRRGVGAAAERRTCPTATASSPRCCRARSVEKRQGSHLHARVPRRRGASETVSTLNFAARVASVELGRAAKNAETSGCNARVAVAKLEDAVVAAEEERATQEGARRGGPRAASRGAAQAVADGGARSRGRDETRQGRRAARGGGRLGAARADREREGGEGAREPRRGVGDSRRAGPSRRSTACMRTGGGWHTPGSNDRSGGRSGGVRVEPGRRARPSTAPASSGILKRRSSYGSPGAAAATTTATTTTRRRRATGASAASPARSTGSGGSAHPLSPATMDSFSAADASEVRSSPRTSTPALSPRATWWTTTTPSPSDPRRRRRRTGGAGARRSRGPRGPPRTFAGPSPPGGFPTPAVSRTATRLRLPAAKTPISPVTPPTTTSDGVAASSEAAAAKLAAARAERAAANARAASRATGRASPPETPPPMHSPGALPPEVNVPVSPPVSSPAGDGLDAVSPLTALALGQFTPSPPPREQQLVEEEHRLSAAARVTSLGAGRANGG